MADAYNSTAVLTNLVKTAYDRKMRLALRSVPQFRAIADTRPAAQTNPGDSVALVGVGVLVSSERLTGTRL
jgi:hypothetical protein